MNAWLPQASYPCGTVAPTPISKSRLHRHPKVCLGCSCGKGGLPRAIVGGCVRLGRSLRAKNRLSNGMEDRCPRIVQVPAQMHPHHMYFSLHAQRLRTPFVYCEVEMSTSACKLQAKDARHWHDFTPWHGRGLRWPRIAEHTDKVIRHAPVQCRRLIWQRTFMPDGSYDPDGNMLDQQPAARHTSVAQELNMKGDTMNARACRSCLY